MKIHLRTIYGCDKRFHLLKDTYSICHPYFETIRVLVTSTQDDYDKVKELESIIPNLKVDKFPVQFWGDYEPICRNLFNDVPENEWIHMLDSDERPTYECLHNLQGMVEDAIANGINICRLPSIQHLVTAVDAACIQNYSDVFSGRIEYAEPSLFKYNKRKVFLISSYGGGHSMFTRTDAAEKLYINPTLHFKNWNNWYQSLSLQGFFMPGIHSYPEEKRRMYISPEFLEFERLKSKFRCYTSSQFIYELLHNPALKYEFRTFALTLKNSTFPMFAQLYGWAFHHDLIPMINEKQMFCGRSCCKYGTTQL